MKNSSLLDEVGIKHGMKIREIIMSTLIRSPLLGKEICLTKDFGPKASEKAQRLWKKMGDRNCIFLV
jgi:hypothetical protein